jgi:hypothetical protein
MRNENSNQYLVNNGISDLKTKQTKNNLPPSPV